MNLLTPIIYIDFCKKIAKTILKILEIVSVYLPYRTKYKIQNTKTKTMNQDAHAVARFLERGHVRDFLSTRSEKNTDEFTDIAGSGDGNNRRHSKPPSRTSSWASSNHDSPDPSYLEADATTEEKRAAIHYLLEHINGSLEDANITLKKIFFDFWEGEIDTVKISFGNLTAIMDQCRNTRDKSELIDIMEKEIFHFAYSYNKEIIYKSSLLDLALKDLYDMLTIDGREMRDVRVIVQGNYDIIYRNALDQIDNITETDIVGLLDEKMDKLKNDPEGMVLMKNILIHFFRNEKWNSPYEQPQEENPPQEPPAAYIPTAEDIKRTKGVLMHLLDVINGITGKKDRIYRKFENERIAKFMEISTIGEKQAKVLLKITSTDIAVEKLNHIKSKHGPWQDLNWTLLEWQNEQKTLAPTTLPLPGNTPPTPALAPTKKKPREQRKPREQQKEPDEVEPPVELTPAQLASLSTSPENLQKTYTAIDILAKIIDPEELGLNLALLKNSAKEHSVPMTNAYYKYMTDPMNLPTKLRAKYHLYYLTSHPSVENYSIEHDEFDSEEYIAPPMAAGSKIIILGVDKRFQFPAVGSEHVQFYCNDNKEEFTYPPTIDLKKTHVSLTMKEGTMFGQNPIDSKSIDLVIMANVKDYTRVEHPDSKSNTYRESKPVIEIVLACIRNILKPGGRLLIPIYERDSTYELLFSKIHEKNLKLVKWKNADPKLEQATILHPTPSHKFMMREGIEQTTKQFIQKIIEDEENLHDNKFKEYKRMFHGFVLVKK